MSRWTGLAPWEFEFPFPGSLTPTFLVGLCDLIRRSVNHYEHSPWIRFLIGNSCLLSPPKNPRALRSTHHPGDNIRANGTSQKWTRPGMPPDSGGILRGCPPLGGAICHNVVSRVDGFGSRRSSRVSLVRIFECYVTKFEPPHKRP